MHATVYTKLKSNIEEFNEQTKQQPAKFLEKLLTELDKIQGFEWDDQKPAYQSIMSGLHLKYAFGAMFCNMAKDLPYNNSVGLDHTTLASLKQVTTNMSQVFEGTISKEQKAEILFNSMNNIIMAGNTLSEAFLADLTRPLYEAFNASQRAEIALTLMRHGDHTHYFTQALLKDSDLETRRLALEIGNMRDPYSRYQTTPMIEALIKQFPKDPKILEIAEKCATQSERQRLVRMARQSLDLKTTHAQSQHPINAKHIMPQNGHAVSIKDEAENLTNSVVVTQPQT